MYKVKSQMITLNMNKKKYFLKTFCEPYKISIFNKFK